AAVPARLVVVVDVPGRFSRLSLYRALDEGIGRGGLHQGDLSAFIDLSNHPALAAQTVIGLAVQTWDDLADGLPEALALASILVVHGLEQMLADTPHRLAAFLEARARHQVVIVLTSQASRVCQLMIRDTAVHLDQSLAIESDLAVIAQSVACTAIAAARQAARRDNLAAPLCRDASRDASGDEE
ncbi:MAG: hypothetical protein JF606_29500, partial [Burkholderiales bacterium]|nr:hypothetical protein [Burkholderiales bacterium]